MLKGYNMALIVYMFVFLMLFYRVCDKKTQYIVNKVLTRTTVREIDLRL